MSNTTPARFRLPNGQVVRGMVFGNTKNGYRKAYVKSYDEFGNRVTVAGRVSAARGFSEYNRIHKFEVNMLGENAKYVFNNDKPVYAVAA